MNLEEFVRLKTCPVEFSPALQALWYDRQGEWEKSHLIVQDASDTDSAWVHAYLHRKAKDLNNARYWYRRSQKPEFTDSLEKEWQEIAGDLLNK